ncbi:MAG: glycosyltransferase family 4 protein [Verrucomicrobiota bacterium]
MREIAYLFERFPSFGQTFCYREVAELERQGTKVHVFSIRHPSAEPPQEWDEELVRQIHYLPEENVLVSEVDRALREGRVSLATRQAVQTWGRQTDFLRLYQAVYIGLRLQEYGLKQVHAHFAGMAARTAFWIERFFGITFSFTAHANDIFAPRDFSISLEKLMERATAVVTVSDFSARFLRDRFAAHAAKVHRVYNGIDLACFRLADFQGAVPGVISVGRLIEKKGFGDLITACGLLVARGLKFTCDIIGEGPLHESLQSQIERAGLDHCVKLVGPQSQEQIAARFASAMVFALPCTRELDGGMDNLPTVIMEAMAAGLPVVSTPLAGVPEMVERDLNGQLIPEHDPGALASAIEDFLRQPQRARELGQRGREIARQKFSIETSAQSLRALFDRTLLLHEQRVRCEMET